MLIWLRDSCANQNIIARRCVLMVTRLLPVSLARAIAAGSDDAGGTNSVASSVGSSALFDVVGLVITVLQVGQYVPQHIEMMQDRSTAGLSPWLIFFGSLYTYTAFLDLALTDTASLLSCSGGAYRCFIEAQPFLQMFLSALLSSALWYWFLLFYKAPSAGVANDEDHITSNRIAHLFYDSFPPRIFFQLNVGAVAFITVVALDLSHRGTEEQITSYAHLCGHAAALLNAVMWLPQIITTLAYGHKGALSFYWVVASVVMDVVYSVYLAFLGFDVSVWINNVPDAIQTSILFLIIVYYERRDRERGTDDFGRRLSMMERLRGRVDTRAETLALLQARRQNDDLKGTSVDGDSEGEQEDPVGYASITSPSQP